MAGEDDDSDRTEEPTQKKLDEALKRGDVVKSQEVSTFFVLGAATLVIAFLASPTSRNLANPLAAFLDHVHEIAIDRRSLSEVYLELGRIMLTAVAMPALVCLVAGIAGNMIQHRLVWSLDPITPKFSKISPLSGLKRIFSVEGLVNFAKGLIKLIVVGVAMWLAIRPELKRLDTIVAAEPIGLLVITQQLAIKLMIAVLVVMGVLAAADYMFQRQRWMQRQRMSRQELKEEFKQTEGNPEIKAKIRQLRQSRSRKRMMAAVPSATVVVTNPTHFAVALKYEKGMRAPTCVAKGADAIALRIREVANENKVPIVENPPLARALYATADLDKEIPEEHYKAVAEVIGFVMRLKGRR